jgi:FkbM family methyltransferase
VDAYSKIRLYLRSSVALRTLNLRGCPLIPKRLWPGVPSSRNAYNTFVLWIRQLGLEQAATVLDVGANHGDFAQAASACFPSAKVFLFEPVPDLQRKLAGMIRVRRPNWQMVACALGSQPGTFPLYVDQGDDETGSLAGFTEDYLEANPRARPSHEILCEVRTLDDVAREQSITAIDLLKIDVEGFEFEVIRGGLNALQTTRSIIAEVSLIRRTTESQIPLLGMLNVLTDLGFHVVDVVPSLFEPARPWHPVEFNVLMRR